MKKIINPYFVLIAGFAWSLALLIFLMVMISSCSTTSKTKSIVKTTVDSSSVIKIDSNVVKAVDSVNVKKDNTVTTVEKEDNYTKVTTVEFEPSGLAKWLRDLGPGVTGTAIDSMNKIGQPLTTATGIFNYQIDPADYFQPIKKITITETGTKKEKAVIVANTSDSTHKKDLSNAELTKTVKTDVAKTETVKNKEVERKNYLGLVVILISALVVWVVGYRLGIWRKFFALFKDDDDEYPIKYRGNDPLK